MFRVGRVDEELPWSGITHLVEHLTLFELGMNPTYTYNGAVTPARTYFVTSGTADDIAAYFAHVTSRLHALPLQRLEAEKTVLLAEASSRPTTPGDLLFGLRYGSRGHGLYLYDELALRQVSGDNVQSWADHWFTRENAVLFVSGEPPPNLRLNLPPGVRRPEPKPEELHLTLPAYAQRRVGGAGAGMVGPDDTTFAYLEGRPAAPIGAAWERALDEWRGLRTGAAALCDIASARSLGPQIAQGSSHKRLTTPMPMNRLRHP